MRGKRVFQPFGDLHPVEEDFEDKELDAQELDRANTIWQWVSSDWYEISTGEAMTGYVPAGALTNLLEGRGD